MSRSRDWVFTLNNYTDEHVYALAYVECTYLVYGKEKGESGTPHLQGYIRFSSVKSLKQVKALMPGQPHLDQKRGTAAQAIAYCKKDGDVTERGDPPKDPKEGGQMEKRRWVDAYSAAAEGRQEDIPADIRFRFYSTIKKIRADNAPLPGTLCHADEDTPNEWCYGPTGTGKSRSARELYPDAYIKDASNKWWDGYNGEKVVICEDVDPYHVKMGYYYKIWGDRYPFRAEYKGGSMMIRPEKTIVTSNYTPQDIWRDSDTVDPIQRRFRLLRFGQP